MQIMKAPAFPVFCRRQRLPLAFGLILLSFIGMGALGSPVVHAAGSSATQVIVAVDETPASCITTTTVSNPKTHRRISVTRTPCVAGTLLSANTVPLSQARAQGEAYLTYPPVHASRTVWNGWYHQVLRLLDAKRRALQRPHRLTPASCAGYVAQNSGWQVKLNDYVNAEADYYESQNCSTITWDTARLHVGYVPYNNPVWWIGVAYANYSNTCGSSFPHLLYPNQTYSMNPDTLQAIGYYGVFYLDTANVCFFQGGVIKNLNVGPLNG